MEHWKSVLKLLWNPSCSGISIHCILLKIILNCPYPVSNCIKRKHPKTMHITLSCEVFVTFISISFPQIKIKFFHPVLTPTWLVLPPTPTHQLLPCRVFACFTSLFFLRRQASIPTDRTHNILIYIYTCIDIYMYIHTYIQIRILEMSSQDWLVITSRFLLWIGFYMF